MADSLLTPETIDAGGRAAAGLAMEAQVALAIAAPASAALALVGWLWLGRPVRSPPAATDHGPPAVCAGPVPVPPLVPPVMTPAGGGELAALLRVVTDLQQLVTGMAARQDAVAVELRAAIDRLRDTVSADLRALATRVDGKADGARVLQLEGRIDRVAARAG
jgi:hypothetical protein